MTFPSDEPSPARVCRRCGAPLPGRARGNVCPACMVAASAAFAREDETASLVEKGEPVVFGDYLLEKELAHGGMGVVYRARQRSLDRTVALKLLLLGRYSSAETQQRFRREAQSAALLRHPGIVAIHEIGEIEGQPFLAMEYVDGGSLADVLRERPLPPRRAAEIIRAVALALQHAHEQGVMHRDVKPSNLLFDARGEVRVTDFGLAKKIDGTSDLTLSGHLAGTPRYLPPEAAAGEPHAGGVPGDVWSLGAVLYECLTGRPPFLAESLQQTLRSIVENEPASPRTLSPQVPRDLETICLKALAKEPSRRFPSTLALADELGRWLRGEPILTRPASSAERLWKWARRRPAIAALSVLTVLAVGAALATLTISNRQIRASRAVAEARSEEARQRLVRMQVAVGSGLLARGFSLDALPHFTAALRLDAGDAERETMHRRRFAAVRSSAPRLLAFHETGPIDNACFNAAGDRVFSGFGAEGKIRLWNPGDPQNALELPASNPPAATLFFDRQDRAWTADTNGALQRWDAGAPAGPLLPTLVRNFNIATYPNFLDFSPDGKWLVAAVPDGVRVFDCESGAPRGPVLAAGKTVQAVRFTPDGKLVAVSGEGLAPQVFDPATGELVWAIEPLVGRMRVFAFSPDGQRLATASDWPHGTLDVWDVARRERLFPPVQVTSIFECVFSADGRSIALATSSGTRVIDAATGRQRFGADPESYVMDLEYSADGRMLAAGTLHGAARIYDSTTGVPLTPWLPGQRQPATVHFSADGRFLLATTQGELRLWELPAAQAEKPWLPHEGMRHFAYDTAGQRILTSGAGWLRAWDAKDGKLLWERAHPGEIVHAAWSRDGRKIASIGFDKLHLWEAGSGRELRSPVAFRGSGNHVLLTGAGDTAIVVNAAAESTLFDLQQEAAPSLALPALKTHLVGLCHSADGRFAAVFGTRGEAWIWDVRQRAIVAQWPASGWWTNRVIFTPDSTRALVQQPDTHGSVALVEAATGRVLSPAVPHEGSFPVALSPDARSVAVGKDNLTLAIMDVQTGRQKSPAFRDGRSILSAEFSPNGTLLLTMSDSSTVSVWDTATGERVLPVLTRPPEIFLVQWSPNGDAFVAAAAGGLYRRELAPATGALERLRAEAELLSGSTLDPELGIVNLDPASLVQRWQAVQARAAASGK